MFIKGHIGPTIKGHIGPTIKGHIGPTIKGHICPTISIFSFYKINGVRPYLIKLINFCPNINSSNATYKKNNSKIRYYNSDWLTKSIVL